MFGALLTKYLAITLKNILLFCTSGDSLEHLKLLVVVFEQTNGENGMRNGSARPFEDFNDYAVSLIVST